MTEVGPFSSMTDAAKELRRPFMPEAVKWKAQSFLGMKKGSDNKPDPKTAKGALIVAHINARLVVERLNLLTPEWEDHFEPLQHGMRCDLTVCGVSRSGYGIGRDLKAAESDALKRAAVKFGVGVSLYAMQSVTLWRAAGDEPVGNKLRPNWKGHLDLDDANRKWLGEMYGRWLTEGQGKAFGDALDHGDEFGAVGDPDDPEASTPEPPADPTETAEAVDLMNQATLAWEALHGIDPRAMTKGAFTRRLNESDTPEKVAELVAEIKAKQDRALESERTAA